MMIIYLERVSPHASSHQSPKMPGRLSLRFRCCSEWGLQHW